MSRKVTAAQLRQDQDAFDQAEKATETARVRRNRNIVKALEQGWTHEQVAQANGKLTRGRIGQIKAGKS